MLVKSEKYPSLLVADLGLRFRDGEADVSDPATLDRLRRLAHMGVVVPDAPEPEPEAPKRRQGKSRKQDD